jgi:hypothetical protein|tara:strand:+ start:13498 stop:15678 length:2181 start_codon:yes stop_codon:yes gene_type:complete
MNNWKLRAVVNDNQDMDLYEANGYLARFYNSDVSVAFVPFGDKFPHPLRTTASDDFGPVSNQVPGICNGTFTHTGSGSATVPATTLSGSGANATFQYTFLDDGTLSTIVAISSGSGYLVGDKLRITTSASHGSQVIEFRLVDGSNACLRYAILNHDRTHPSLPFPVHKFRINNASNREIHILDYRSSQVFPKPQDKLLDKYPDAAAAYGLRLLRSAYLGPAIRVRRTNDNAEKDIYMDSQGNLDTATLTAFGGSFSLKVNKWYDQSGNGNDASQTAGSAQPTIYSAGALVTVNGKPALDFDGSDDSFSIDHTDLKNQDRFDAYMHYQTSDGVYIMFVGDGGGKYSFVPQDTGTTETSLSSQYDISGTQPTLYVNGIKPGIVYGTTNRDDLHTMMVTNAASHSNGAIMVHEAAGTQGWTDLSISTYSGFRFDGKMTEMVLYNTDQSASREGIEKDMALHSGAYQVEDAPLLDAYGGAHAAYSLRKLNSDYTGAAVRIARDSDLAEQDIGFDANGNLDTAAALAFCPSQYGRIKKWYDQSGNGNDTTQSSQAGQPILVEQNNSVITVDGQPALRFFGTDDILPFDSTGLDIGNLSSFLVCKVGVTSGTHRPLTLSGPASNNRWYAPQVGSDNFVFNCGNESVSTSANTNNNLHTMIAGATQGDAEAFINGTSVGTMTLDSGIDPATTGIGGISNAFLNGFIQEVVVYSSDQSERRLGIERNISNHYDL